MKKIVSWTVLVSVSSLVAFLLMSTWVGVAPKDPPEVRIVPAPIVNEVPEPPCQEVYVEHAPDVEIDFHEATIDLGARCAGVKWLGQMAEEDAKFSKPNSNGKNALKVFKTKSGDFRMVTCMGRQSTNPEAYCGESSNSGMLMRHEMMQTPSGKWVTAWPGPFEINKVVSLEGKDYFICDYYIFRVDGPDKLTAVVSMRDLVSKWSPSIQCSKAANGSIAGKYWEIHKSSESDFGGLLEYVDGGKWKFHCYHGIYHNWIEEVQIFPGKLVLLMDRWDGKKDLCKKIQFDPMSNNFTDL